MKTKFFIIGALLSCFVFCYATRANITGSWAGLVKTSDGGEMPVNYTFKADSGKVTGTAKSPQGSVAITNGQIEGDDFSFGIAVSKLKIEHSGRYYSAGDSVSMDIDFNGKLFHTTLKRAAK